MSWADYPCIETPWDNRLPAGYGRRYISGSARKFGTSRYEYSHRTALGEKLGRPLRDGMWALHHCDWPPCIQPEHLYEGTPADNHRDMWKRLRARPHGRVPSSGDARQKIRRRYATGDFTLQQLADEFGYGKTSIARFVRGEMVSH